MMVAHYCPDINQPRVHRGGCECIEGYLRVLDQQNHAVRHQCLGEQTLMASLVGPRASLRTEAVTLSLSTSSRILANLLSKLLMMRSVALSRPCTHSVCQQLATGMS